MNEYEKDILKLLEAHAKIGKSDVIRNINKAVRSSGIYRKGKNVSCASETNNSKSSGDFKTKYISFQFLFPQFKTVL